MFGSLVYNVLLFNQFKVTNCDKCSEVSSKESRLHQRCITAPEPTVNLTSISRHLCTLECIRRRKCLFVNYNTVKHYCLLIDEKCIELKWDDTLELRYFGLTGEMCLPWVPVSVFQSNPVSNLWDGRYPARWRHGLHIVPGKYVAKQNKWSGVLEGGRYETSDNIEVLQVRPECQVVLVDYSAGNPIPDGAVIGGYLATGAGSDVYVIQDPQGFMHFGYYDPNTELVYTVSWGVRTYTKMKMMILIWYNSVTGCG